MWLTGLRSARTRRAYAAEVVAWLGWLAGRETGALAAGRVHVDLWVATQLDDGAASSVRCRLSALSSFYRYCAAHDLIGRVPTEGVAVLAVQLRGTASTAKSMEPIPWRSWIPVSEPESSSSWMLEAWSWGKAP